jgi:hypothetical protein
MYAGTHINGCKHMALVGLGNRFQGPELTRIQGLGFRDLLQSRTSAVAKGLGFRAWGSVCVLVLV